MNRRTIAFVVLGILSIGLVGLTFQLVGLRKTIGVLEEARWPAIPAVILLSVLWISFGALAWDRLSRPLDHRVPYRTLFKGMLIGFVGNVITPSLYLGGEALRVAYVGRRRQLSYYQLAGTVVLCKYLEFMVFVLLMCLGTTVALVYHWDDMSDLGDMGEVLRVAVGVGAGVLLTVLILLIVALRGRHHPISAAANGMIRMGLLRRFLVVRRRRIRKMEDQISQTFNMEGWAALKAFVCLAFGFTCLFLRPLVFFCLLKDPRTFSFPELCLIFTLSQFVLALQFTPGSLGPYEMGMLGIFAILDVGQAPALAYVVCTRAADIVLIIAGLLFAAEQGIKILRLEGEAERTEAGAGPLLQPDTPVPRSAPTDAEATEIEPVASTADPPDPPPDGPSPAAPG